MEGADFAALAIINGWDAKKAVQMQNEIEGFIDNVKQREIDEAIDAEIEEEVYGG